jgi:hypothetical protein
MHSSSVQTAALDRRVSQSHCAGTCAAACTAAVQAAAHVHAKAPLQQRPQFIVWLKPQWPPSILANQCMVVLLCPAAQHATSHLQARAACQDRPAATLGQERRRGEASQLASVACVLYRLQTAGAIAVFLPVHVT